MYRILPWCTQGGVYTGWYREEVYTRYYPGPDYPAQSTLLSLAWVGVPAQARKSDKSRESEELRKVTIPRGPLLDHFWTTLSLFPRVTGFILDLLLGPSFRHLYDTFAHFCTLLDIQAARRATFVTEFTRGKTQEGPPFVTFVRKHVTGRHLK